MYASAVVVLILLLNSKFFGFNAVIHFTPIISYLALFQSFALTFYITVI